MTSPAAEIFVKGAKILREDPRRCGNTVNIEGECSMLVSGDLHGNRPALARIIQACGIRKSPTSFLLLQELIHGELEASTGLDRSVDLLLRAVRLLIDFPTQVLFVMGNHDLAQATGGEITKNTGNVCQAFAQGVLDSYGEHGPEVLDAIYEFLLAMPLAIRLPNRLQISHTLPCPWRMKLADPGILTRPSAPEDLKRGGPVYEWTWGRNQNDQQLEQLAEQLDVDLFVLGHRHVPDGIEAIGERAVILNSDNLRGCVLPIDCTRSYSVTDAMQAAVPVSALV